MGVLELCVFSTWGDAVIGANIDFITDKTNTAFGRFDIAMDRSIEIIWGVDRGFFLKVGILAVGAGGDGIVNVFSNIIIFFWPTASIRGWRTFGAGYRSPFFEICLMTPRTQTPAIYSTFIGIILIMVDLFIFFSQVVYS